MKKIILLLLFLIIIFICLNFLFTRHNELNSNTKKQEYIFSSHLQTATLGKTSDAQLEIYKNLAEFLSKKAGVSIKYKPLNTMEDVMKALEEGKSDIGYVSSELYLLALESGIKLKHGVMFTFDNKKEHPYCFCVKLNSNIKSIQDLKGKKVYISPIYSFDYIMVRHMLYENKISVNSLNEYFGGFSKAISHKDAFSELIAGETDAVFVPKYSTKMIFATDPKFKDVAPIICSKSTLADIFIFRSDVDQEIVNKISESAIKCMTDPDAAKFKFIFYTFNGKVVKVDDKDFESLKEIISLAKKNDWYKEWENWAKKMKKQ